MHVIAMTGANESRLSVLADVTYFAPAAETYRVQEFHLPVYHALCAMLEAEFFAPEPGYCGQFFIDKKLRFVIVYFRCRVTR